MAKRYTFTITSQDRSRDIPRKLILAQNQTETVAHVALKLLAYLLFYRERIQVETALPDDTIPFLPDLVQLDYSLHPVLWIECGECTISKLHKLAVKAPEAEIWIVKRTAEDAQQLLLNLEREKLRTGRYHIVGLDREMFEEVTNLLKERNEVTWFRGTFEPPLMQFDLDGLWFEAPFTLLKH